MAGDDHYIAGSNAHLDLASSMDELALRYEKQTWHNEGLLRQGQNADDFRRRQELEFFHHFSLSICNASPIEPASDQLLCRFLTPEKFLWFLHQKAIFFCVPDRFDDALDCVLPEDYQNAVALLIKEISKATRPADWFRYCRDRRRDWLVSCWTEIERPNDNVLIWHKYAGGASGVGVTVTYETLKHQIGKELDSHDLDGSVKYGRLNYENTSFKQVPFNKRPGFENENEVRFALRHFQYASNATADISSVFFESFGLRFSVDCEPFHKEAAARAWELAGGNMNRIQEG